MNADQIATFMAGLPGEWALVETHISWVLLGTARVYKIRKPIRYAFLDFSTQAARKADCEKELVLNRRTSPQVYLGVVPLREADRQIMAGTGPGKVIDHAVEMVRLDNSRQMDVLLVTDRVSGADMRRLAIFLAGFHRTAEVCQTAPTAHNLWLDIADVLKVEGLTRDVLGRKAAERLRSRVEEDRHDLLALDGRMAERHRLGFTRDVHGDLHSRNIFLLPEPVLFDCLEFNDHLRRIDLLNELAFLGMDLEFRGRGDLWAGFLDAYQAELPVLFGEEDRQLMRIYMGYRANVRFKVFALRVLQDPDGLDPAGLQRAFGHFLR